MKKKAFIDGKELGTRAVPTSEPHSFPSNAVRLGFSADEIRELERLYGHLETKNAN